MHYLLKRTLRFFVATLLIAAIDATLLAQSFAGDAIRVGIFQNKPIVYFDNGPKGLFVEVLDHIAREEKWQLEYVTCELKDCLKQLTSGQLDLMTSLGENPERLSLFSFSKESIWTFWGTIYARDIKIQSVLDLQDKVIGVRKNNNTTAALQQLLTDFKISAQYVEFDNYEKAFADIQHKKLDAVAVNNTYVFNKRDEIQFHRTPIVFNPFSASFAAPKNGRHLDKLAVIDDYVRRFKADRSSVLHTFDQKWFGGKPPYWSSTKIVVLSLSLLLCSICGMAFWRYRSLSLLNKELAESIAEQKKVEHALRKSEENLLDAQDIARMGRWELDLVTNRLFWSEGIYKLFEVDRQSFVASYEGFINHVHPDDRILLDLAYRQSVADKTPYNIEHRLLLHDGRIKWVSEIGRTEYNEAGCPIRSIGTIQDISERKQTELKLQKSEAQHRILVQTIPDLIWLKDKEGFYLSCNRIFERFFGAKEAAILGKTDYDFIDKELADFFVDHDRKAIAAGKAISNEEWITFADDGHQALLETIKTPMYDDQGTLIGVLGIGRDITDRKRAEKENATLEEQLQQAQKLEAIGQLAGGVAHDFNNMLAVIHGHAEMAMEQLDPGQPLFSSLDEIRKAAERSANITRQLLTFARKQAVTPKVLDLNESLELILKMLRRLIGEDIDLVWIPGSGLWPVMIDPSQLDQILANLCINARAAIAGVGKITVETENSTLDEDYTASHTDALPGEFVRLTVSDSGCGMDKATLAHIFEPFFTTKNIGEGTGLGLATVFGAVKQNNGFINVYSEPGLGASFAIYLPRYIGKVEQQTTTATMEPAAVGHETILLVEDEMTILDMTTTMLKRLGYTVLAANSPGEAMSRVREFAGTIHLLITDVVMPEMNGRALADRLLQDSPQMKCLFMSGYTANIITNQGVLDEGLYFIQKPFSREELATKVRQVLESDERQISCFYKPAKDCPPVRPGGRSRKK